jgi:hypothetical protein
MEALKPLILTLVDQSKQQTLQEEQRLLIYRDASATALSSEERVALACAYLGGGRK